MKTAILLGATGLVGSALLQQLLKDSRYGRVKVFTRRRTGVVDPKLDEYIIDFDRPERWQHDVKGDVLFSALGTTIKQAGSKNAQYKVDYTYQYQFALAAALHAVPIYILVSAAYASPDSQIFYSRIKGELEKAVSELPFHAVHILKPGVLLGNRKEGRMGERISIAVLNIVGALPGMNKWKPIAGSVVARAMRHAAADERKGRFSYTLDEVFRLAEK